MQWQHQMLIESALKNLLLNGQKKMMESTGEQKRENAYIELIGTKFDIDYTVNEIKQIFEM